MKKIVLITLFFIPFFLKSQNSVLKFAADIGGNYSEVGRSIALDILSNVYTTGSFEGTTDFDPGVGVYNLTSISSRDIFISKLDSTGNFIWAKNIGGQVINYGVPLTLDVNKNVF